MFDLRTCIYMYMYMWTYNNYTCIHVYPCTFVSIVTCMVAVCMYMYVVYLYNVHVYNVRVQCTCTMYMYIVHCISVAESFYGY